MKPKLTAIFLIIATMLPFITGCSIFSESNTTDGSTSAEQLTIPYLDNYYVNKPRFCKIVKSLYKIVLSPLTLNERRIKVYLCR